MGSGMIHAARDSEGQVLRSPPLSGTGEAWNWPIRVPHGTLRVRWHVVDIRAICVREFAAALGSQGDTLGWLPQIRNFAPTPVLDDLESIPDRAIRAQHFSIQ